MSKSQLTLTVESVRQDECRVVVAALGDKTIHRDALFLDRAVDRRQFIESLVTQLPAIVTGAEVSPELIEQELLAMAAQSVSKSRGQTSRKPVAPGTKVLALDRDNIGTVLCDRGESCLVQFIGPEGHVAEKVQSKSQLRLLGGDSLNPASKVTERYAAKPEPFPVDLLPTVMRNYINEGAAARCIDPAIVALPLLVTLAGCIGTTRRIMLKPDWIEPPTLWGAVVARSGSVKSPGFDLAIDLLSDAESSAYRDHCDALAEYRKARLDYERALSRWKRAKGNEDPPEEPPYPAANRLLVEDTTIEALAPILNENVQGLLLLADELRGWFDGMGAYQYAS